MMEKSKFDYEDFLKFHGKRQRNKITFFLIIISLTVITFGFLWPAGTTNFDDTIENYLNEGPEINVNSEDYKIIEYMPSEDDFYRSRIPVGSAPTLRPLYGNISSRFGYRRPMFSKTNTFHRGVDIVAAIGSNIYAAGDGIVEFAGYRGAYGYCVIINHNNGYSTLYAHCKNLFVRKNQQIQRGTAIATVGNTGSTTGAHLHYEIRKNGYNMNPEHYFTALPRKQK